MNLRTKIPLIHIALFLGVGLCLLFWALLIGERQVIGEENDLFVDLMEIAASNAGYALRDGDRGQLRQVIETLSASHHVNDALFLDQQGRILAAGNASRNGEVWTPEGRVLEAAALQQHAKLSNGDWVSTEVEWQGISQGRLMIAFDHGPLMARIAKGRHLVLTLGLFTLLSAVLTSFYLARKISRPMEYLVRRVSGTNPMNLGEQLQVKSGDEVELLANAFNEMSARLQENYHAIERAKYEWEKTFDSISDPMFIHDTDCRIIRCNWAYAEVAGLSYAEILNRPYYDIFPRQDGPLQACEPGAAPPSPEGDSFLVTKQDRQFNIKMFPVEFQQENRSGMLCLCEDVTEENRAHEKLKRSEEGLKNAQRIAHIGSWDWDIGSNTLCWSDEIYRLFGVAPEKFVASYEAFLEIVYPEDRVKIQNAVNDVVYRHKPYDIEHRIMRPDGSVGYVHELGEMIFDEDGKPSRMSGTVHDITAQKRAEMEAHDLFIAALTSLVAALEAKSSWTKGHSDRVAEYASQTAAILGLDEEHVERIRIAALLHDIGKIGTSETILDKVGRLTEEEYEIVKMHPARGAEMLAPIRQLHGLIPWIRGHHERWDGNGYPDHLRGEDIPLEARILAVADTFDSMTAVRPYRKTPGFATAMEELQRCAGTQFDPEIIPAFISMMQHRAREPQRDATVMVRS